MPVLSVTQRARLSGCSILFAAGVLFVSGLVFAQERLPLRGEVTEDDVNASLLGSSALTPRPAEQDRDTVDGQAPEGAIPEPRYRAGDPVDDADITADDRSDNEAISVFDLNRDDPFADDALPDPSARSRGDGNEERPRPGERRLSAAQRLDDEADRRSRGNRDSLDEQVTGTIAAQRVDDLDEERNIRALAGGDRAEPIEGRDIVEDDDPYAATGIRSGSFDLFPEIEQGLSWTSNADSSTTGSEAVLSETTLRLNAVSDWSRHAASIDMFGTYRKSISGQDVSLPSAGVDADLRLDLIDGFSVNAGFDYRLQRENAISAVTLPGVASQPLAHRIGGDLTLARSVGKLQFAATGRAEREFFEDAELADGSLLSQSDRNATLATLTLRTGYEVSPALTPFIEAEIGRRFFDEEQDSAGFTRSADRYAIRAGVEFDLGEKLTGEMSAGWVNERPDDPRLAAVDGLTANAALAWSPIRGTTVSLDLDTTVETTTDPGVSGSILYASTLGVERQLRANLIGNLDFGLAHRDFRGSAERDLIASAEAGFTWWFNRNFGLTGRARYETVTSNVATREADTTSIFLGVRLRR